MVGTAYGMARIVMWVIVNGPLIVMLADNVVLIVVSGTHSDCTVKDTKYLIVAHVIEMLVLLLLSLIKMTVVIRILLPGAVLFLIFGRLLVTVAAQNLAILGELFKIKNIFGLALTIL